MDARNNPGAGFAPPTEEALCTAPLSAEQVFRDYAPRVYHMVRRMVSSDADAEDVTQDVLLQVVRKLPTFRGEAAFPTWLHRITVNAALSHRRRRAVRQEHRLGDSLDELGARRRHLPCPPRMVVPSPDVQLLTQETQHLIDRAIAALPSTYRTVFVLAEVEGLPNAVIADTLGLSLPAIKSRLHRARLLMRDALAPHFEDTST